MSGSSDGYSLVGEDRIELQETMATTFEDVNHAAKRGGVFGTWAETLCSALSCEEVCGVGTAGCVVR